MIEDIATESLRQGTYHFAYDKNPVKALEALELSPENIAPIASLLSASLVGDASAAETVLLESFRPKVNGKQSRFSDGALAVFYSALERETAQSEIVYHCPEYFNSNGDEEVFYYRLYSFDFQGTVKNLCGKVSTWPFLVEDREQGGYDKCNAIAKEAITLELDGLLTPSARRKDGICLPVFSSDCLTNGRPEQLHRFVLSRNGQVNVVSA